MKNIAKPLVLLLTGVALCAAGTEIAFAAAGAQGIGSIADNITKSMGSLAKLLTAASYIFGLGFVGSSLFKFKAHKDNPQQIQIGTPITLLVIGAALIFLPSLVKTSGTTIFGSGASIAGPSGISNLGD